MSEPAIDPTGSGELRQRICGGTAVPRCGWPSTVSLGYDCTGVLVHPEVVVYAAHCGREYRRVGFGEEISGSGAAFHVETEDCETYPGYTLNSEGEDFAVCKLSEQVTGVPIVPILMGCETELISAGQTVTLVGYGEDENRVVGIKREVITQVNYVTQNNEASIGGNGKDSCYGDSGGPAFVQLPDRSWRVFAITSYGTEEKCGSGTFSVMLHAGIEWLEDVTGIDLTPCHDADGTWAPTSACQGFPLEPSLGTGVWPNDCGSDEVSAASATCGDPYYDAIPPVVFIRTPAADAEPIPVGTAGYAIILVIVEAHDGEGLGVAEIRIQLDGVIRSQQPEVGGDTYSFNGLELGAGSHTITAIASDRNGNRTASRGVTVYVGEQREHQSGSSEHGIERKVLTAYGTSGCSGVAHMPFSTIIVMVLLQYQCGKRQRR